MKIVVLEPIHAEAMRLLRGEAEVVAWDDPAKHDWSEADAVIVRAATVTREQITAAPKLKVIGKHGIGVNAIDVAAARERGIAVVYTPQGNVNSVAELVVSMMLAVSRNLFPGMAAIREGGARIAPPEQTGLELSGKALGLVGFGHIGSRVAAIAREGFGMDVHVFDPYLAPDRVPSGVALHPTLEELLGLADYISVSVPLTASTRGLIGAAQLACCKKTAVLVNTARGGVVDEAALYAALAEGRLFGAACDVFEQEPPSAENPLFSLPCFIGSLHIGANTEEALSRVGRTVASDVLAVLNGREPRFPYGQ